MENLLAFIEFTQFQRYLTENMDVTVEADIIEFPSNIPLSAILEEKIDMNIVRDAKTKAFRIYQKYVAVGSEFEINVSYESREKAKSILSDLHKLLRDKRMTSDVLFKMFEDCRQEIWMLLIRSYWRFRSQPEFDEFDVIDLLEIPPVAIHFSRSSSLETYETPTM